MLGRWIRAIGAGMVATAVCSGPLAAQAADGSDLCSLSTDVEFQEAEGVNPAIGKDDTDFALLCPDAACVLRAIVIALDNVDPIPNDTEMFQCDVVIEPGAAPGTYGLAGWNVGASDARGNAIPAFAAHGSIVVLDADDRGAVDGGGTTAGGSGGCQVTQPQHSGTWLPFLFALILWVKSVGPAPPPARRAKHA